MSNNIFKGQQKPTPHMGPPEAKGSDAMGPGTFYWWNKRPQWQAGKPPEGFNPVYQANTTQPPQHPESTPNFSLHKKVEK